MEETIVDSSDYYFLRSDNDAQAKRLELIVMNPDAASPVAAVSVCMVKQGAQEPKTFVAYFPRDEAKVSNYINSYENSELKRKQAAAWLKDRHITHWYGEKPSIDALAGDYSLPDIQGSLYSFETLAKAEGGKLLDASPAQQKQLLSPITRPLSAGQAPAR